MLSCGIIVDYELDHERHGTNGSAIRYARIGITPDGASNHACCMRQCNVRLNCYPYLKYSMIRRAMHILALVNLLVTTSLSTEH